MTHAAEKLTIVLFTSKDDREQGPGFESIMLLFWSLGYFISLLYLCLSEEMINAIGPIYLLSMPRKLKYTTQVNM